MKIDFFNIEGLARFNPNMLTSNSIATFNTLSTDFYPTQAETGKLYVISFSEFLELDHPAQAAGYICIGNISASRLDLKIDCPVMLLSGDAALNEVFNRVLEAIFSLRKFDEGKTLLLDALAANQGIRRILNIAADLVNNPFYFIDINYCLIAWSINIKKKLKKNTIITNGMVDDQIIAAILSSGILETPFKMTTPVLLKIPEIHKEIVICALTIDNKLIGFLLLCDEVQPFHHTDIDLVDFLKKIILAQMSKSDFYKYTSGTITEYFLIDLLKGSARPDTIEWQKQLYKIKFGEKLVVMVINTTDIVPPLSKVILIKKELGAIIKNSHSVVYQDHLVFIIDTQGSNSIPSSQLARISYYLEANQLKSGFSNLFSNISMLNTYYAQACTALSLAALRSPNCIVNFYSDYIVDYMLQLCTVTENSNLINFSHPAMAILANYDKESGTNYLSNLKIYIDCLGNMSKAAQVLGIHYNTMKYRVKAIEKIASISLKDPLTYVNLFISFRQNQGLENSYSN